MSFLRKPVVGYLILTIGILLAVYIYTNSVNDNLRDGLQSSCQRVNILRAQSNLSDAVTWTILASAAKREQSLIYKDKDAAEEHKNSAQSLTNQTDNLTVTGMTDCKSAIERPRTYNVPKAVRIGNVRTIEISPEARKIIKASMIAQHDDG